MNLQVPLPSVIEWPFVVGWPGWAWVEPPCLALDYILSMVFPSETGEIPIPECELPKGQSIGRIAIVGTNLMFIF